MKIAEAAICILVFLIAAGMVMILAYKPEAVIRRAEEADLPEKENYVTDIQDYLRTLSIRWPQLNVLLEKHVLSHCILFHWAGLQGGKKTVLFAAYEQDNVSALFEAVISLSQSNRIPCHDFWIAAVPDKQLYPLACEECGKWLRAFDKHIDFILQEGLEDDFIRNEKAPGFLVTGNKSVLVLETEGDWKIPLMKPEESEVSLSAVKKLMPLLPWRLKMQWKL